jgi:hypothetical protein
MGEVRRVKARAACALPGAMVLSLNPLHLVAEPPVRRTAFPMLARRWALNTK